MEKKKIKKYTSIEVKEDMIEENIILEVKNRKFDKTNKIEKII